MKNKYSRAIEKVKITPEMHDRIMKQIERINIGKEEKKPPFFRAYGKVVSVAACLVLLLAGAFAVYNSLIHASRPPLATNNSIVDCGSLSELSDAVGFKVREAKTLPFSVKQTAYASFWGKLAQIKYSDDKNTLVLRMSAGSEDNSGDYGEYGDEKSISVGDYTVTMKGNGGLYNIAVWEYKGYSYSVNVSNGISEEEMGKVVGSVE